MFYNILLGILATQIYGFLYPVEYTFIKNNVTKNINNFFENYKEELNPSIMCVGYNLLYFCSFTQIKYNKTKSFINKHIGSKLSFLWLALINFLIENKLIENKPTINVISIYKDGLLINEIITNRLRTICGQNYLFIQSSFYHKLSISRHNFGGSEQKYF